MITNISLVSLWVKDIDEAKTFYTEVLGFVVKDDIVFGDDFHWCTVSHPAQPELQVHLTTPSAPLSEDLQAAMRRAQDDGGLPGLGLAVDDCRATVAELKGRGVEFIQEPQDRPYGVEAVMRDNSGNWLVLVQAREFTPDDFNGVELG